MMLCLDIGNTHIYGGLFHQGEIGLRFRFPSGQPCTSDTLGLFLKNVIKENHFDTTAVKAISISSVVPALNHSVITACENYFAITPIVINPNIKTNLSLAIDKPSELGADRIANAVGALAQFPGKNLAIFDFGTATTACAISKAGVYLGGAILPGFKLSLGALVSNTALLSGIDFLPPKNTLGTNTESQLQIGIYYSQLGAAQEILRQWQETIFKTEELIVIATGGYARLLAKESIFDIYLPDLVLHGLREIWNINQ